MELLCFALQNSNFFILSRQELDLWVSSFFFNRWVEQDPMEILESVKVCTAKALDKATADGYNVDKGLKAIGIANQRETTVVWSKLSGLPLYNAIVWMDVRTSSICRCVNLL